MFKTESDRDRADWPLLHNGPLTLFWRETLFAAAKNDLTALGYLLIEASCENPEHLFVEVSAGLRWEDQFGYAPWTGNLDALNDALHHLPDKMGDVAICLERFHDLMAWDAIAATGLLDVLAGAAWGQAMLGRRFIVLVQTDDADFHTERLGGGAANWNLAEWLNANRGR